MALILNASFSSLLLKNSSPLLSSSSFPNTSASFLRVPTHDPLQYTLSGSTRKIRYFYSCFEKKREFIEAVDESEEVELMDKPKMTLLYSFIPLPLLFTAALPGGKINTLLLTITITIIYMLVFLGEICLVLLISIYRLRQFDRNRVTCDSFCIHIEMMLSIMR